MSTLLAEGEDRLAIVDGEQVGAVDGDWVEVVDPSSGGALARVADCGPRDVEAAIESARAAFGRWRRLHVHERVTILTRMAELLREHAEELAVLETRDVGKPLRQARGDIELSARYFEYFAGIADKIHGETIPVDWDSFGATFREPLGVTAHISPWNYPLVVASRSLAPALAAGNACVLKPAEETPLTALELGRLALEAGLPPGVLNVVPGRGETAGAALAGSPGIDHISFTGSPETGTLVMKAAADNWKPVSLELGGKSPNVVFADADLVRALPTIVRGLVQNCGQTCSAATRLLVERPLHGELVERLSAELAAVSLGPGLDDPDMGPLVSAAQLERVRGFLDRARADDATIVTGGNAPDDPGLAGGYFVAPALVDGIDAGMEIAREEVFGPVLAVLPFDDYDHAVELANDTPYGLAAGIWTRDVTRALRAVRSLDCGQVYVNTYALAQDVAIPFGGYKKSGFGREKGVEAIHEYTQVKAAMFRFDENAAEG